MNFSKFTLNRYEGRENEIMNTIKHIKLDIVKATTLKATGLIISYKINLNSWQELLKALTKRSKEKVLFT